jgi:hypothetical protein
MIAWWQSWVMRYPSIRRVAIKTWRVFLRMQRATTAQAVLILRRGDGRILALPTSSGKQRLPGVQLNAHIPILAQVEELGLQLTQQNPKPTLVAIDGTPGPDGVTFIFTATLETTVANYGDQIWLEPDVAAVSLGSSYYKLLGMCDRTAQ